MTCYHSLRQLEIRMWALMNIFNEVLIEMKMEDKVFVEGRV